MKKLLLIDYILYSVAKLSSIFLMGLPVKLALKIGRLFGALAYILNYKRARIAYSNMRAAFSEKKEPSEILRIVKLLYRNFGETLVEVLRIPRVNKAYIDRYVTTENDNHFYDARAKGRGVIFLTGHFGNWELSSITSANKDFPLMVLAREQKMSRLNDALNAYRESKGCKVIKKGMATREIYEHLGKDGVVGILSDQDAGKRGIFVNFFGRPTSTAKGAFALSRKTGAVIIPTFMIRVKGPRHRLVLESPIEVAEGESGLFEAVQRFASILERNVRSYPEQWLWLHKRWKSTPLRKVVILNDGKTGHLNQSLAVFERIKECRREFGYSDADAELRVIDIQYRSKYHKIAIAILSSLVAGFPFVRMKSLSLCLAGESYDGLKRNYADIVISCGSRTAAANLLFSRENNAKSIILMKPALVSSKNFDLAIVPEHDSPAVRENIVTTEGVPNLITQEKLDRDLKSLERMVNLEGRRSIGLFIGGENRRYKFDIPLMKEVLDNIIETAKESGMNVLVTTSRRTSTDINDFIKKQLKWIDLCKLLVIANERNPEWTMGGMLAASDIVVISGESSSMLSEAASSGKHVVVFMPIKKSAADRENKHEVFLNRLHSSRIVHVTDAADLKNTITGLVSSDKAPKILDDNRKIREAVMRII